MSGKPGVNAMSAPSDHHKTGAASLARWLFGLAARQWRGMATVLLAMLLKTGLDLLKPWPLKVLVDHALSRQPMPPLIRTIVNHLPGIRSPIHLVYWCVAGTILLFVLSSIVSAASAIANLTFGQQLAYGLAADLFAHLQRLSLRFHHRKSLGDSIRRVTTDSGSITTIVKDALIPAASSACSLVIMFLVLLRLNWSLALVSLAVVPMLAFTLRRYAGPMLQASYGQQEVEGKLYEVVERTLSAMPIIQAFTREEQAEERFRASTDASLAAAMSTTKVQLQFKVLTGLATALGTAAVLWIGGRQAMAGRLSVGEILVFLSYLSSLYAPLEALAYTSSTIQNAAGSARRVMEILTQEPEIRDRPDAIDPWNSGEASALGVQDSMGGNPSLPNPELRTRSLSAGRGAHVRIENVTFGYDAHRPILRSVSVDARLGQTIAIVGPTGAGKSTLVGLIPRFFDPWDGRVTLDGYDLRNVQLKSLRRRIAIVLQDPLLFPMTIAENIAYGRPDATPQEIEAAAQAANAQEFIEKLQDGYDTVVGPRGATLSGGQRQRLSIARALLKDAPVLILDEPTSALDPQTEALLMQALGRLMKDRTTLVIAHRLSTIRHADQIIVMDQGQVRETGTHDQLISAGGLYTAFHRSQFGGTTG